MPAGRPTKYKAEYAEQVYKLCVLGLVDKEIAEFFEVSESTLNLWKKEHAKFSESMGKGKVIADANTAVSLYKRANGYEHDDIHFSSYQGEVTKTEYIKHYPPDVEAAKFFLKNRQRDKWKDRIDNTHSDPDGGPIQITRVIVDPKEEK
jgi:serine protease inhibitor